MLMHSTVYCIIYLSDQHCIIIQGQGSLVKVCYFILLYSKLKHCSLCIVNSHDAAKSSVASQTTSQMPNIKLHQYCTLAGYVHETSSAQHSKYQSHTYTYIVHQKNSNFLDFSWAEEIQIAYHVCDTRKCEGHNAQLIK